MLSFFSILFRWRTLLTLAALAGVSALIWFFGPLLRLNGVAPLAPEMTRIYVIVGLFALVFLVWLIRYVRARRANARLINRLMDSDGLGSLTDTQTRDEVAILRERFEEALKTLKETRIGGAGSSGFLLDLPWYIIIGPPGSGKTTILRNSGLEFPLAERVGADVLQGVGGTRNCDWWFTNDAVLLDTAGRYTTQDSNNVIDRAAWRGFLDLLKEFRPRRPINGVLLAVTLADIIGTDPATRAENVEVFRRRLQELMRSFGIRLPVYLLITKVDLLAGFTEFFDDLTDEEREQIWGFTFTPSQAENTLAVTFNDSFSDLVHRVLDRGPVRLHEERDPARRRLIFNFPQQFGAVRGALGSFINEVFRPNRYEISPMLRGVFLTSGTQEGTPVDRLMASFARAFGLPETQVPPPQGRARTFFIRRVLTDVVFAESGLVGLNRRLERRLALTYVAGYAAAVILVALLGLAWFSAYSLSTAEASDIDRQATELVAQRQSAGRPNDLIAVLPELNAARGLAHYFDGGGFFDAWLVRLGLSSEPALAPRVQALYERLLRADLLPLFVARVQGQLRDASLNGSSNTQLHDLLAIYLMLDDPQHFGQATMATFMRADAEQAFPLDPARRGQLSAHYLALLNTMPVRIPLDRALIADSRRLLVRIPRVDLIYAALRADAERNPSLPALNFAQQVGSSADIAFSDTRSGGLRTPIPGFFTRNGFYNGFVGRLPAMVAAQMQTDWVLGGEANAPGTVAATDVIRQVSALYVRDYIDAWRLALNRVVLTRWNSLEQLQAVLQALVSANRPMEKILGMLQVNTNLARIRDNSAGAQATPPAGGSLPERVITDVTTAVDQASATAQAAAAGLAFPDPWPGDQIKDAFSSLLQLIDTSNNQAPAIAKITDGIAAVSALVNQIASSTDPTEAALRFVSNAQQAQLQFTGQSNNAPAMLRADALTRPEPIRTIMLEVANSVAVSLSGGARQRIVEIWRSDVLPQCQIVVANHYPFVAGSKDETPIRDFADFFKPGGTVDNFAKQYAPNAGRPVAPGQRAAPGPAGPLPPEIVAQLAIAGRIRAAFFGASATDPTIKFSITPVDLDPGLARVAIDIDKTNVIYRHDPPRAVDFQWPTSNDSAYARITVRDFRAEYTVADERGAWSLFRMLDAVGLRTTSRADQFSLTITKNEMSANFVLTAASSVNPFTLNELRRFRCLDNF